MPTLGQTTLLLLAVALFFASGAVSAALRLRRDQPERRGQPPLSLILGWLGVGVSIAVLVWRAVHRQSWLPLESNFDALVWLGLLLAGVVLYIQSTRPIGGIDWFLMPVVILLLVADVAFGKTRPHEYDIRSLWTWAHLISSYGGTAAFVVGGAAGVMYLLVNRRLKHRTLPPDASLGNLERLETLTRQAVTLGFALLTVGLVTGLGRIVEFGGQTQLGAHWFLSPKVLLTFCVWLIYGLILHAPIRPVLRGQKSAVLSVVGVVLIFGTLVAVQYM